MTHPTADASQTWSRLIRFRADGDPTIYYGEPVNPEIDVGLAVREGEDVEAWVIETTSPWDESAQRTSEKKVVETVSNPRQPGHECQSCS